MKLRSLYPADEVDEKISESGGTSTTALAIAILSMLLLINAVYWTAKLSPVFSTLNENLGRIEQQNNPRLDMTEKQK